MRVDDYLKVFSFQEEHINDQTHNNLPDRNITTGNRSGQKLVILRHDVDARPQNSLKLAYLEHSLGIHGTYYFRMPNTFHVSIIREIAALGHEIGYHYETMATVGNDGIKRQRDLRTEEIRERETEGQSDEEKEKEKENEKQRKWNERVDVAYKLFMQNLSKLREIVPVTTICMHGSPLSRYDNREIWGKYDYRELGILGEVSMDVDFSKVAYYTDTGRRWDGAGVSIRDKVPSGNRDGKTEKREDNKTEEHKGSRISVIGNRLLSGILNNTNFKNIQFPLCHTTFEMIKTVEDGTFPKQAMLTVHPQRWNDALIPWAKELVWQNVKNVGKWFIIKLREKQLKPPHPDLPDSGQVTPPLKEGEFSDPRAQRFQGEKSGD